MRRVGEKQNARMNKRKKGTQKEALAAAYLGRNGVKIVRRNYRVRQGEIDLIGWEEACEATRGREKKSRTLVFFEVKYRKSRGKGSALEAVTPAKQRQISRVSLFFLNQYHISDKVPIRYDVVAIDGNENGEDITWVKNAFPFMG